jgi:hypothetical protein
MSDLTFPTVTDSILVKKDQLKSVQRNLIPRQKKQAKEWYEFIKFSFALLEEQKKNKLKVGKFLIVKKMYFDSESSFTINKHEGLSIFYNHKRVFRFKLQYFLGQRYGSIRYYKDNPESVSLLEDITYKEEDLDTLKEFHIQALDYYENTLEKAIQGKELQLAKEEIKF